MKITKKVREEAALLCAMMASTRKPDGSAFSDFREPCSAIGVSWSAETGSAEVARQAYWSVDKGIDWNLEPKERTAKLYRDAPVHWGEAEALLRTGWTP